jgi:signal transduction histidine kinase
MKLHFLIPLICVWLIGLQDNKAIQTCAREGPTVLRTSSPTFSGPASRKERCVTANREANRNKPGGSSKVPVSATSLHTFGLNTPVVSAQNQMGIELSSFIVPTALVPLWFTFLCTCALLGSIWFCRLLRAKVELAQIHTRLEARMEERRRISRELHDTLLQGFHGIVLRFQAAMKQMPEHDPARDVLEMALNRAEQVLFEGRQRVHDLRENTALCNELPERFTKCANELLENYPGDFRFSVVGAPETLNAIVIDEICAVACEALRNAFNHSRASTIEIEVTYGLHNFRVIVRDDGVGIPSDATKNKRLEHYGFAIMRERATKIGAELNVWTRVGVGTEIDLRVDSSIAYSADRDPLRRVWLNPS